MEGRTAIAADNAGVDNGGGNLVDVGRGRAEGLGGVRDEEEEEEEERDKSRGGFERGSGVRKRERKEA